MKKLITTLSLLALLAGVLLTIWGLVHLSWPQALPWAWAGGLTRYLVFMAICAVIIVAGSYMRKISPLLVGAVIAAGLALLAGALWPLLVTLWFTLASAILGRAILAVLKINTEGDWLTHFLIGAGVYGTAVGLLAHFPVNYPGVYGAALTLPLLLGWRVAVSQARSFLVSFSNRDVAGFKVSALDVAIATVALIYFVVALLPELGFDALWQHLFVVATLSASHQWGFDAATYVWAVIPMLGDWIFSISYMLAGETATRLTNIGFIFVIAWLLRDIVLWAGGSVSGARWAVLIFLSTPLTFTEGSTLFIESVFASFVVAGVLFAFKACSIGGDKRGQVIAAGILLGCALATKAVTLMTLPALLVVVTWRYRAWLQPKMSGALVSALLLLLVLGAVPYINAWWLTGNPVFPFFNKVFQSPLWHPVNFEATAFGKGVSWDTLYQVIFHSDRYLEARPGAAGFQWLMLFLPAAVILLLGRQTRGTALLFVGVASIVLTFFSTAYLRYIFPSSIILIAAIGVAMSLWKEKGAYARNALTIVGATVILVNLAFLNAGSFYSDFPLRAILSGEGRSQYLSQRLPMRNAVELVNHLNTGRSPVAIFSSPLAAGLHADALYPDWTNMRFQQEIGAVREERDFIEVLSKRNIDFVVLDANWNGAGCCADGSQKQAIIEAATEKIAEYGAISVRKLKANNRFKAELLENPNFISAKGWTLADGARYDGNEGGVLVSVAAHASQWIAVSPGRRYLHSVVARCFKEKTQGRIQVNWHDAENQYISTDIQTFECSTDWAEYTMEVAAPASAHGAVVYAAGHTPAMIEFKSVSLRQ